MNKEAKINLAIAGAAGRMGRSLLELAAHDPRFRIVAALVGPNDSWLGRELRIADHAMQYTSELPARRAGDQSPGCDVLIDFTLPEGTMKWLEECSQARIAMVCGVTGHDEAQLTRIRKTAEVIPVLLAANFSVGIHAIVRSLAQFVENLGDGYDIEIVETHHRDKIDAPSGTAKTLLREIQAARDAGGDDIVHGRLGQTGPRSPLQIGVHSVRMGDVVGTHEIHFSGHGESITIRHTAHSRDAFAAGALRAAAWITNQRPGLYSMNDV